MLAPPYGRRANLHNRSVMAALKHDRKKRAANVGDVMMEKLVEEEMQEAWRMLKGWYRTAKDRAPKPCYDTMAKQMAERAELYANVQAPGAPIPINIEPFAIDDSVPKEPEIRAVVKGMCNGRAGGASGIKAEEIKQWLQSMLMEEEKGVKGLGDNWWLFVELIRII